MQVQLPHLHHHHHHKPGQEGQGQGLAGGSQYSSSSYSATLPPRREDGRYTEEEIRIIREREDDRYRRRPGVHREEYYREELKEQQPRYCPIPILFPFAPVCSFPWIAQTANRPLLLLLLLSLSLSLFLLCSWFVGHLTS